MKTQHTKGNWTINNKNQVEVRTDRGVLNVRISQFTPKDRIDKQEANAKLIAAAPEMLDEHITDVVLIQEYLNNPKNNIDSTTRYFLQNLLVPKKEIIKKATE